MKSGICDIAVFEAVAETKRLEVVERYAMMPDLISRALERLADYPLVGRSTLKFPRATAFSISRFFRPAAISRRRTGRPSRRTERERAERADQIRFHAGIGTCHGLAGSSP